jgi:hypothetical protein
MEQKFKIVTGGLFITALLSSCHEHDPVVIYSAAALENSGIATQLGKKLESPYSVKNMKKALANLQKSKLGAKMATAVIEIVATPHCRMNPFVW